MGKFLNFFSCETETEVKRWGGKHLGLINVFMKMFDRCQHRKQFLEMILFLWQPY